MAKSKKSIAPDQSVKKRCIEFEEADPYFPDSYKEHYKKNSKIEKSLETFRKIKANPPEKLPNGMRDHTLQRGSLAGISTCHLAGNSCLLYTFQNDVVTLLVVCDHDEIEGPRSRSLFKKLNPFIN